MPTVNSGTKELTVKVVYYGPGLGGKTTNLRFIHSQISPTVRSELIQLATETERTLHFDFLSLDLGSVENFKIRMSIFTVPGQTSYEYSRRMILIGVDAIVFVADSQKGRLEDNALSLTNMARNLQTHGMKLENVPWVMQYNKRDLTDSLPVETLQKSLNTHFNVPAFEAIALDGSGVFATLRAVSKAAIEKIRLDL
jgi:signal recognition particle receptor subunit beta